MFRGAPAKGTFCDVELEIRGDDRNGYHLVMTPEGFFTADSWHETQRDAMQAAHDCFGVITKEWKTSKLPKKTP